MTKAIRCDFCTGFLRGISPLYYGQDCERTYCSKECLKEGEDRALRYRAALAGTVSSHWMVAVAGIIALLMIAFTFSGGSRAWAHDHGQVDNLAEAKSEAYGTCCVGDDYTKLRIEEWEPTESGWRIRWHGQWLDVPRRAKVANMVNPDADAKAWVFGALETTYVRCFMPGALM